MQIHPIIVLIGFALLANGCSKEPDFTAPSGTFEDIRDQHEYGWVRIGGQIWMSDNLAYLPDVRPSSEGSVSADYQYVYGYDGTNVENAKATTSYQIYGVLYNWPAAMKACPVGWHLPSDEEWIELEVYLGMSSSEAFSTDQRLSGSVGLKLKSSAGWPLNGNGNNSGGFNALPSGTRFWDILGSTTFAGSFSGTGFAHYWSSTDFEIHEAWYRVISYDSNGIGRLKLWAKANGFSVRCVKDE